MDSSDKSQCVFIGDYNVSHSNRDTGFVTFSTHLQVKIENLVLVNNKQNLVAMVGGGFSCGKSSNCFKDP